MGNHTTNFGIYMKICYAIGFMFLHPPMKWLIDNLLNLANESTMLCFHLLHTITAKPFNVV